jgi:hypothetical protein
MTHLFRTAFAHLTRSRLSTGLLLATLLGVGGFTAYRHFTGDCCQPGSPCCYPGSPCCHHGGAATAQR